MTDEPGLFDEPERLVPLAADMTPSERRAAKINTRIANGVHPLGRPVLLHQYASRDYTDHESGPRCGSCHFRRLVRYHDKTYPKCFFSVDGSNTPRVTHSDSSDVRKWWPGCMDYKESQGDDS